MNKSEYNIKLYQKKKKQRIKQINEYQKLRKQRDLNYKQSKNLRKLLNQAINYYEKTGRILICHVYPIYFDKIIKQLSPFPDRNIYCIDHKKALCYFDLTDSSQIEKAFSHKNLQWLTKKENCIKGKKEVI